MGHHYPVCCLTIPLSVCIDAILTLAPLDIVSSTHAMPLLVTDPHTAVVTINGSRCARAGSILRMFHLNVGSRYISLAGASGIHSVLSPYHLPALHASGTFWSANAHASLDSGGWT